MSAAKSPEAEGANEAGDAPPPAKSGRKKLLLIGIGVAAVLIGGGAGAYFAGLFGGDAPPAAAAGEHGEALPKPVEPTYWAAPDLVVTLNTGERKARYLKLRTTLELANPADVAKVEEFTPRLIDYCQIYLRELRPEELRGSVAIIRLREELLRRINLAVAPVVVRNVYFTDILVE